MRPINGILNGMAAYRFYERPVTDMPDTPLQLIQYILTVRCESHTVEVKAARQGAPRLYDTLSSFSNQEEGGAIVFGVDESSGYEVCGVYDAQLLQKAIVEQCREMEPVLRPTIELVSFDGKQVVVAYVQGLAMGERPAYRRTAGILRGSFVRVGDSDERMTDAELYEIDAFKKGVADDASAHPDATRAMLDENALARYVLAARDGRSRLSGRSDDEVLRLTGVLRDATPTLAGMMALGDYPQRVYRNCCLTAVAVAGTHLDAGERGVRFLDNRTIEGSVPQMMEEGWAFVARNTRSASVVSGLRRDEVPEYPELAVREMIANALVHRDYGPYSIGTPVRLVVYADRIECVNPGGIFGGSSVLALGRESLPTRNPTLVSILEITRDIESRHSGIPAMRGAMRRAGLPEPEFSERRASFVCTLRSARPKAGVGTVPDEEKLLAYCQEPRSRREIAALLGIREETARRTRILPLVRAGKLALTLPDSPRSKRQRYVSVA